jgi:hypothetical protein
MTHRHRAVLGALAALSTAALLAAGAPLAASAATPDLDVLVQHHSLTIPYGDTAPAQRVFVGNNDFDDFGATDPQVKVELVDPAGAVTTVASALPLEAWPEPADFPDSGSYEYGAEVSIPSDGLVAGDYTVRVTPAWGDPADPIEASTAGYTLVDGVAPAVTSVTTHRSISRVFPVKDGYRDRVTVRIGGTTSTGHAVETTGTAVLKRGTHTVQTWRLGSSAATITWNGRDHGKVVAGTYRLTVTQRGRTGGSHRATTTLTVDRRSLHSRTISRHYTALQVLGSRFTDYSTGSYGDCYRNQYKTFGGYSYGAMYCEGYDALAGGLDNRISLSYPGGLAIPAAVRHSTTYGRPSVTVGQHTWIMANHASMRLSAGDADGGGRVYNGYTSHGLKWSGNPSRLRIAFDLSMYCWAGVKDYSVTWHYKVLS